MKQILLIYFLSFFFSPILMTAQNPTTMDELIGVNIRAKDGYPQGFKKFGLVREYHEWASDVGYDTDAQTNCSFQTTFPLRLNPSTDPSTLLNFDGFYSAFSGLVSPCLKGVAPPMRGLKHYCDLVLEQKPVCLGDGQPGYGDECDNQFASKLTVIEIDEDADNGSNIEKIDFPTTWNTWDANPSYDGYYDGIGLVELTSNTSYTGEFTIKRNLDWNSDSITFFFVKVWLDTKKGEYDAGADVSDGHFNNQAYKRNPADGSLIMPLKASTKYEAITLIGENNDIEHMLILKPSDFNNAEDTTIILYKFDTYALPQNGLYRLRITVNSMVIDGNPYTQPYELDGNPIIDPNKNNLHTYSWPDQGIPGKAYWKPIAPSFTLGDIWDVGLMKCGPSPVYPTRGELWPVTDYATQIGNFSLSKNNQPQIILNQPFQPNNLGSPILHDGYNNFADFSRSMVVGNDYHLELRGLANADYDVWLKSNSATATSLVSGSLNGAGQATTSFNLPATLSSGIYRLRVGIGDNPQFGGNFEGELRDYLLLVNNSQNVISCEVPLANIPINNTQPVGGATILSAIKVGRNIDQDDPAKYKDAAEWATIIAAKYGVSTIPVASETYFKDRLFDANPVFSQGDINYIEIGNEQDKFWRGDLFLLGTGQNMYQMIPSQYAAYLSASYDGGCRSSDFEISGGEYLGVKNVAPNIRVANGGLAGFQGRTLEETIDFCVNDLGRDNSTDCSDSYLPFDVINFHHYCTTTNAIPENSPSDGMYGTQNLPKNSTTVPVANRFEYFYENPTDIGLNGGIGASPEEGGLKTYIELTLERVMAHVAAGTDGLDVLKEFAEKEVWLSEFGYDSELGSPVSVKDIPGQSLQQTQADWLVRSFLEISAAEATYEDFTMKVHRAMAFDYRDTHDPNPLYQRSGLLNADYEPKKSWYHVQTMRNVLGKTVYQGEFTGHTMTLKSGTFDFSDDARIYHYRGDYKGAESDILVIWSPNSSDSEGELTLDFPILFNDAGFQVGNLTIIKPQDGDEDGLHFGISGVSNNTYTFTGEHVITETPMYVVLNAYAPDEAHNNCPEFVIEDKGCTSFTLRWKPMEDEPAKVDIYVTTEEPQYDNNGNLLFDVSENNLSLQARDFKYDIRKHGIGHLESGQSYYIVFVMKWADGTIKVCGKKDPVDMNAEDGLIRKSKLKITKTIAEVARVLRGQQSQKRPL